MACRQQKRKAVLMRKRLHILRALTCSKSVTRLSIITDALLYIYNLKLKLEKTMKEYLNLIATRRSYLNLLKHGKEVKVEKLGNNEFVIRVTCERRGDHILVSILEAFEEMGVCVLQARVSCNHYFSMEAIAVANDDQALEVRDISQAILKAIDKPVGEGVVNTN
ncbi:hypothetical protein HS088_TW14G00394 [Tripterygium wilfordii]|uniref:Plant bHLH transcription factor ACT-like domain-containing protein n=1 Tax=Tripterygium wilfordii TaxID=458696 RepID=A0A7J7CQV8_TRIWF|nr:uncharacterized protein LOC120015787 [Tripterygium wilfordii]KAF5736256.1 hypothetical protein HS088_TW14G00394 [Tripterygium wilfordii]